MLRRTNARLGTAQLAGPRTRCSATLTRCSVASARCSVAFARFSVAFALCSVALETLVLPTYEAEAQTVDRTLAEEILVAAGRSVLEDERGPRFDAAVLVRLRVAPEMMAGSGLDTTDLGEAVALRLGARTMEPLQETFCDTNRYEPHLRSTGPDFRLALSLVEVTDSTAYVSVSGNGRVLSGTTVRRLELARRGGSWDPVGYGGTTIHGTSSPCKPTEPELTADETVDLVSRSIVEILRDRSGPPGGSDVPRVCLSQMRPWYGLERWDRETELAIGRELVRRGGVSPASGRTKTKHSLSRHRRGRRQ